MIDISSIESKHLEALSNIYLEVNYCFNTEPCDAPANKQKKMRLWLEKNCKHIKNRY